MMPLHEHAHHFIGHFVAGIFMLATWVFILVTIWQGTRAHKLIAQSLQQIAQRGSEPKQEP